MATEKIKRPLIAHFLDTSKSATYEDAEWSRIGVNVTRYYFGFCVHRDHGISADYASQSTVY